MTKRKGLNVSVLTVIMLSVGLMLAFSGSVNLNGIVCLFSAIYLVYCGVSWRKAFLILLFAFPLALGSWWSFIAFGTGDRWHQAFIYGTRVYAYLLLGMTVTMTTKVAPMLMSLHQHLHLSETFVYGLLASFNLIGRVRRQYQYIRYSALMRRKNYHLWQPGLYLRIILVSLNWSQDLAEAMTSQGFSEGEARTQLWSDSLPTWQWVVCAVLIIAYAIAAFVWRPW